MFGCTTCCTHSNAVITTSANSMLTTTIYQVFRLFEKRTNASFRAIFHLTFPSVCPHKRKALHCKMIPVRPKWRAQEQRTLYCFYSKYYICQITEWILSFVKITPGTRRSRTKCYTLLMTAKTPPAPKHTRSTEKLHHFSCGVCKKWWSIGDAPLRKKEWYCPWCGTKAKH
jgi:hypothetical protein